MVKQHVYTVTLNYNNRNHLLSDVQNVMADPLDPGPGFKSRELGRLDLVRTYSWIFMSSILLTSESQSDGWKF